MDRAPASFRVAVLASGTGTNLQAILDRVHGRDAVEVVAVGSDKPGAPALERRSRGRDRGRRVPGRAVRRPGATRSGDRRLARRAGGRPDRPRRLHAAPRPEFVRRFRGPDRQRAPGAAAVLPRSRRDRPGARSRRPDHGRHGPLRRRGRRLGADHPPARRCRYRRGSRPWRARSGDPRDRARAAPRGDPDDRRRSGRGRSARMGAWSRSRPARAARIAHRLGRR